MKNLKSLIGFCLLALVFIGCEQEEYKFGDIKAPTNLVLTPDVVGKSTANPMGDGSGVVKISATAQNAISYKFIYAGQEVVAPSGNRTITFGQTGKYAITVIASGVGGTTSSKTIEVEVLVVYVPPAELVKMLTNNGTKTWRIDAETVGHFGVAPADAVAPIWWSAPVKAKDGKGAYDDRFVFNVNKSFTHKTNGTGYGQAAVMITDFGSDKGIAPNGDKELENYPLAEYTENWSLSAPGGKETLSFSGKAYHGFYVGGDHKYLILARTENTMHLKTIGKDGNSWFVKMIAD